MGQVSPYLLTLPPSLRSFLFLFPSIRLITYHSLAFFLSHGWNSSQEQDHSPGGTCHVPGSQDQSWRAYEAPKQEGDKGRENLFT